MTTVIQSQEMSKIELKVFYGISIGGGGESNYLYLTIVSERFLI